MATCLLSGLDISLKKDSKMESEEEALSVAVDIDLIFFEGFHSKLQGHDGFLPSVPSVISSDLLYYGRPLVFQLHINFFLSLCYTQ